MEVARSKESISVSQRKYTLDFLKKTGMFGCRPIDYPKDPTSKAYIEEARSLTDRGIYQRLVGKLIYLAHTRPDIGFK